MTSTCATACVVCDIDGFTGINNSTIQGQAPPGFCTTVVHHMQWIAFIAGSTNLTLEVEVFNCDDGPGLEVGIYRSLNCQSFQLVSNCDSDVGNNTTATFTNTVPLVIGQYYYFVMDGNQGDVCNYTIHVVSGSTAVAPLTASGNIEGGFELCPGPAGYSVSGITGATEFTWTVDGDVVGMGPTPVIQWTSPGEYELCVQAANACDEAPPSCRTVNVTTIPEQRISTTLCSGECLDVADTTLCDPGNYDFHFETANGCDSVIRVDLQYNNTAVTNLDLHICDGDTLYVAGQPYFQTGQYQEILTTAQGCDSTINLALDVIICQIAGNLSEEHVHCFGESSGALHFSVANGTPPFHYAWERIGTGGPQGTGMLAGLNTPVAVGQLPAGEYAVTVTDNFGNQLVLLGQIETAPLLTLDTVLSDYNGYAVSCASATDASATVQPAGGEPPYAYLWSDGSLQNTLTDRPAGLYTLTVTDAFGCEKILTVDLNAPPPLTLNAVFNDPGCDGPVTGSIDAGQTGGGVPPYAYDLSGNGLQSSGLFPDLPTGPYVVTVRDANGCTASEPGDLVAPLIPVVSAGEDRVIDLGEETLLSGFSSVPADSVQWSPAASVFCGACLETVARPSATTAYVLTVGSPHGCFRSDTVWVRVNRVRNIYLPNVFSPNDDSRNDRFVISSGVAVENIRLFRVYSRWGELVYEGKDLAPNDPNAGWDGRWRGKTVDPGVFAWLVEARFVDGVVQTYEGSVTVLP